MPFALLRSICSCVFKAIWLSCSCECKDGNSNSNLDPTMPNESASESVFSFTPSLQESSIAPMSSSLIVSEPSQESSKYSLQSSSMIGYGYGAELTESSSPDSADLGKDLSSIFNNSTSDSSSVIGKDISGDNCCGCGGGGNLVTPLEDDTKNIVSILQSTDENNSELRPYNLNATHFHEHSCLSVESITPSEPSTANKGKGGSSMLLKTDASPDSTESIVADKKKYPVTPYPKFEAFSSPTATVQMKKRVTKLPKSVITMRRGLVKTRVGHIQKKLDRQLQEHEKNCSWLWSLHHLLIKYGCTTRWYNILSCVLFWSKNVRLRREGSGTFMRYHFQIFKIQAYVLQQSPFIISSYHSHLFLVIHIILPFIQ